MAALFLLGITVGTLAWDKIVLPFSNPWGVIGRMSLMGYNPANNIARFVVFVLLPSLSLVMVYLGAGKWLRDFLFSTAVHKVLPEVRSGARTMLLLIAFSVVVALNSPVMMSHGIDPFHEGETLGTSVSYMAGQVPYKDFIFAHGVYQDPLRAVLSFKLFGRSIASARTIESTHNVLAFILLGIFALKLFRGRPLAAFATVLSAGLFWFLNLASPKVLEYILPPLILPSESTTFGFLIAGLSAYRLCCRENPSRAGIAVSGFMFSLIPVASFAYSVDKGFFLLAAFIVLTPLLALLPSGRNRFFLASLAAGFASGTVIFLALVNGGAIDFIKFVLFTMPRYKELMDGIIYPINVWSAFLACALCAFNLFWLVKRFLGKLHKEGWRAPAVFVRGHFPEFMVFVLSIFLFRSALGRSDLIHIATSILLTYILFAFIVLRHFHIGFIEKLGLKKAAAAFAAIAITAISLFGAYRIHAAGLIKHNFPLGVKDEEFIPRNYMATIDFLRRNLGEGETFFTLTSEAIWYYFLDQPAVTRFPTVWFGAPLFYQQEIINDLEKSNVKYIIYTNSHWSNFIDGVSNQMRLYMVNDYISREYKLHRRIYDNEIWIKKTFSEP